MSFTLPHDVLPLWAVFVVTLAVILAAVEVGYRLGRERRRHVNGEKESPVGGMVAAVLGLLAFLLAFVFGLAASRFEARRQTVLNEANAIGTTYLRTSFLPDAQRDATRRHLRAYVDVRLAVKRSEDVDAAVRRSEELQNLLWAEAASAAAKDPRSVPVGLFVQSLNETIDLHADRVFLGTQGRVPPSVWGVLFLVAAMSMGAMGYHGGLTGTTRSPAVLAVAIPFALVILLIADLDRPKEGWMQVGYQPLEDVQRSMATPP